MWDSLRYIHTCAEHNLVYFFPQFLSFPGPTLSPSIHFLYSTDRPIFLIATSFSFNSLFFLYIFYIWEKNVWPLTFCVWLISLSITSSTFKWMNECQIYRKTSTAVGHRKWERKWRDVVQRSKEQTCRMIKSKEITTCEL